MISGNTSDGVEITGSGTRGNEVAGNSIGLNAAGTSALANDDGVAIDTSASGNTIGGPTASARNVISGNSWARIKTDGGTSSTVVQGNFIGTDLTGMTAIGNIVYGVRSRRYRRRHRRGDRRRPRQPVARRGTGQRDRRQCRQRSA